MKLPSWLIRSKPPAPVVIADLPAIAGRRLTLEELRSILLHARSSPLWCAIVQVVAAHRSNCIHWAANKGNHVHPGEAAFEAGGVALANDLLATLYLLEQGQARQDPLIAAHFPTAEAAEKAAEADRS